MTEGDAPYTKIETVGSYWWLTETHYCRMPKSETGRQQGWGDEDAGPLQDAVWHEYTGRWELAPAHLLIEVVPGKCIRAPRMWEDIARASDG